MKGKICILIILLQGIFGNAAFAQLTGPEQDCIGAIPVCQTVYVQNQSYQGIGAIDDLVGTNSCLDNNENNSVWYVFTITISGVLEFSIIPQAGDDYDFALYNLTGGSCNDIFNGTGGVEVRCNYAFGNNATGLQAGSPDSSAGPGGAAFLAPLNVTVGETYALLVDNFSSTSSGYAIDFAPSANTTASILDFIPPSIDSIVPPACDNTSSITVIFSEPISCNSLQADGSNFSLSGPSAVTVTGSNCTAGSAKAVVQLTLSAPIMTAGTCTLIFNTSVNGLTLEDGCGNAAVPATDTFTFYANAGIEADFSIHCISNDTIEFINTSVGDSMDILWEFGDGESSTEFSPLHTYSTDGNYTVNMTASNSGCAFTITETVGIITNFFVGFNYPAITIHPGQAIQFTNVSIPINASYLWDFGDGSISFGRHPMHFYALAGTYMVCLIGTTGCYADTLCKVLEITDWTSLAPPLDMAIEIFPNPVEDVMEVRVKHNTNALTYSLFNYMGVKLLTGKSSSEALALHVGGFPAGVYFLKIESGQSLAVKEIIKL